MSTQKKYRAFISYSQKDKRWARKIHRWLESYRIPAGVLVQVQDSRKLGKFFRDDDEMAASTDLATSLITALDDSESLIVICSPNAARSTWVDAEISHFRRTGRHNQIFAIIVDGEPNSAQAELECFPPSLRSRYSSDEMMPIEPLGINLPKEGKSRACARLAAGLLGISFDDLWQREQRRKTQQVILWGVAIFSILSVYAIVLAMQTRTFNGEKAEFFGQLANLQNAAVDSTSDEDIGQFDRAIRFGILATRAGLLHPVSSQSKDELARALHNMPNSLQLNPANTVVEVMALDPAAQRVLMSTADPTGQMLIVDLATFDIIDKFQHGIQSSIRGISWHPLNNWVSLFDMDGQIYIFDVDQRNVIFKTQSIGQTVLKTSFSDDGKYLLAKGWNTYFVWDITTGEIVDSFTDRAAYSSINVQWIPYTTHIAVLPIEDDYNAKQTLTIRNVVDKSRVLSIGGTTTSVRNYSPVPSGKGIVIHERLGDEYRDYAYQIAHIELSTANRLSEISVPDMYHFNQFTTTPHGAVMGISSHDNIVRLFDLYQSSKGYRSPEWHIDTQSNHLPQKLTYAPVTDSSVNSALAVGYANGVVRIYHQSMNGEAAIKLQAHNHQDIIALQWLNNDTLLTHAEDGNVMIWDLATFDNVIRHAEFKHMQAVNYSDLVFMSDKSSILTVGDHHVRLMGLPVMKERTETPPAVPPFEAIEIFSVPARFRKSIKIVNAHFQKADAQVRVLLSNGESFVIDLEQHYQVMAQARLPSINASAVLGADRGIVIATDQGMFVTTSLASVKLDTANPEHEAFMHVVVSNDHRYIAGATDTGAVNVWSTLDNRIIGGFTLPHTDRIELLSFTPDGTELLVNSHNSGISRIRLSDFEINDVPSINAIFQRIRSVAFTPDGDSLLVQGSNNQTDALFSQYAMFDLNSMALRTAPWFYPISEKNVFLDNDRLLYVMRNADNKVAVCSVTSQVCMAQKKHIKFIRSGALFDPQHKHIVIDTYGQLTFWDIGWLLQENVRDTVCSGSIDRNLLTITQADAQHAPMLRDNVGQSVCDLTAGWLSSNTQQTLTAEQFLASLTEFASPKKSSLQSLKHFLAHYEFTSLENIRGDVATKANIMRATGYMMGIGVAKDRQKAERILRSLLPQGDPIAQFNLAMLLQGELQEADHPAEAQELIELSARSGFWAALRHLGRNAVLLKDYNAAEQYFKQAVDAGDNHALTLVAQIQAMMHGRQSKDACEDYQSAMINGAADALFPFIQCLNTGVLTEPVSQAQLASLLRYYASHGDVATVRMQAEQMLLEYQDPWTPIPTFFSQLTE